MKGPALVSAALVETAVGWASGSGPVLTVLGPDCSRVSVTFKVLLPTMYPSVFRSWPWGTCNRASVDFWKEGPALSADP